jgi:hypothetical protein
LGFNKDFSVERAFERGGATRAILIAMARVVHEHDRALVDVFEPISGFDQFAHVFCVVFVFATHVPSDSIDDHEPRGAN